MTRPIGRHPLGADMASDRRPSADPAGEHAPAIVGAARQSDPVGDDPLGTAPRGAVQDRPLEQLRGSQRLQYTWRRVRAYLNLARTEPSKLGNYPQLRWLVGFCLLFGLVVVIIAATVVPGPRLGPGSLVFVFIICAMVAIAVVVGISVGGVGLDPLRGRHTWHLTSIQTDAGYAAFRYRRHPARDGYELVDLWTTHPGAKLAFGRVVPYLVDTLGDQPMHLTAATAKLASVYEEHGFRAVEGTHRPYRNYRIPMTRPAGHAIAPRSDSGCPRGSAAAAGNSP